jgi:pimeloyl-ACP methyl ester carboxylesterase
MRIAAQRRVARFVLVLIGLLVGTVATAFAQPVSCTAPDHLATVKGQDLCIAIATYRDSGLAEPISTLLVWLHGDVSSGGAVDYLYPYAATHSKDALSVAILRPGYFDANGKQSSGSNNGRLDSYTAENVDALADAIRSLRQFHKVSKVVAVGHSGGAAITAVILGRHPGVIDAAILASCPCDIVRWREGRSRWSLSLDPASYVDKIPVGAKVAALTGSDDTETRTELARDFVKKLSNRGVDARFEEVRGAGHRFGAIGGSDQFVRMLRDVAGFRDR